MFIIYHCYVRNNWPFYCLYSVYIFQSSVVPMSVLPLIPCLQRVSDISHDLCLELHYTEKLGYELVFMKEFDAFIHQLNWSKMALLFKTLLGQ